MKQLNINTTVDFNQELQHMIDYTLNIWDGDKDSLTKAVTEGFTAGYLAAEKWISEYGFSDFIIDWMESREKLGDKSDMLMYDDVTKVAKNVMFHTSTLKQLVLQDWNYEKNTRSVTNMVKSSFIHSKNFPKGWQQVVDSNKSAFEYFDHFNLKEDKKFKGYNSDSAGASGFHERINLPNTFYGDSEQGRNPLYNLVSSSFAHGLTIREHNNTFDVFNEIKKIKSKFSHSQYNKPVFIADLQSLSDNKFFKALMIDKYSLVEEREYHSQIELDNYLKQKNENKYIYGMLKFSMIGNDDYQYQGFTIQKIYQLEHFEQQIKQKVDLWFNGESYKDIYYSDNNCTPVNKDEILSSLFFKQVSQKEFEAIQKLLGCSGDYVSYGQHEDFMDYTYPSDKDLVSINATRLKSLMSSLNTENKHSQSIQSDRENTYKKAVYNALNMTTNTKNKLK